MGTKVLAVFCDRKECGFRKDLKCTKTVIVLDENGKCNIANKLDQMKPNFFQRIWKRIRKQ